MVSPRSEGWSFGHEKVLRGKDKEKEKAARPKGERRRSEGMIPGRLKREEEAGRRGSESMAATRAAKDKEAAALNHRTKDGKVEAANSKAGGKAVNKARIETKARTESDHRDAKDRERRESHSSQWNRTNRNTVNIGNISPADWSRGGGNQDSSHSTRSGASGRSNSEEGVSAVMWGDGRIWGWREAGSF
jgi:hypothetical protein